MSSTGRHKPSHANFKATCTAVQSTPKGRRIVVDVKKPEWKIVFPCPHQPQQFLWHSSCRTAAAMCGKRKSTLICFSFLSQHVYLLFIFVYRRRIRDDSECIHLRWKKHTHKPWCDHKRETFLWKLFVVLQIEGEISRSSSICANCCIRRVAAK